MNVTTAPAVTVSLETPPAITTDTLTARLSERRISQDVIETFNIRPQGSGWTYTTPNGATRWKNADREAGNKYAWIGSERDTLLYLFDLREAVQMAGGAIWLCTEFDYFAIRSAGIYHAIAQMQGEGSVPADLAPMLQSLGVLACYIAPDRDEAGTRWAQKVANTLIPAGIDVIARTLPGADGYDLGEAWRTYTGKLPFERYLLDLPNKKMQAEHDAPLPDAKPASEIPADYRQAVANALGVTEFDDKGYSQAIRCIFHDDQKPSAGLHKEYGLHCFTCGKWYTWKELGQALNIGRWQQEEPPVYVPAVCLSDEALQALVREKCTALARLLSVAYSMGWQAGREFTAKEATALLPGWTVYQALEQGERIFFGVVGIFILLLKNTDKTKKIGRKAQTYRLPSPAEVNAALNVKGTNYTPIDGTQSAADFRAELYSRPIQGKPGKYARKWLCDPLGISPRTGSRYDERAGLDVTPNYDTEEVTDAETLPDTPERRPVYLLAGGKKFSPTKAGYERAAKNGRVTKVTRQANTYRAKEGE